MTQYADVILTTRGDLLTGAASGDGQRLAVGTANQILKSDGTDPSWSSIVNANVDAAAAIVYSKLSLSNSILNADISSSAAIADGKLAEGIIRISATVSLTQAQIIALNATPIQLVAAPGAGKAIVPLMIEFFHDYAVAAYTNAGGGHIVFEWGDGTDAVLINASRLTDASDANVIIVPDLLDVAASGTAAGQAFAALANQNFRITKQTAELAAGDATNIAKIRIHYRVITLLV